MSREERGLMRVIVALKTTPPIKKGIWTYCCGFIKHPSCYPPYEFTLLKGRRNKGQWWYYTAGKADLIEYLTNQDLADLFKLMEFLRTFIKNKRTEIADLKNRR